MQTVAWLLTGLMTMAVIGMVALEWLAPQGPRWRYGAAKLAGVIVFLVAAVHFDVPTPVACGLVCCAIGDVMLIPRGARTTFALGLAAFLLGHLCYAWSFARGLHIDMMMMVVALIAVIVGVVVMRWMMPSVPAKLKVAVAAYVAAILTMAACATVHVLQASDVAVWLALGAWLFCASDVFVARERFVSPGLVNRVAGIPLYFYAQLLLAAGG
jgi:uncharacterized membrane protein YhhN